MPLIDRTSPAPYYQQIYEQIATGIEEGIYPPGKKLPSIRECARELGVSNTTVELAYQKLSEQGYVLSRRGSGYTICELDGPIASPQDRYNASYKIALEKLAQDESTKTGNSEKAAKYDFAYDAVDPALFPFTTWARISRDIFFSKGSEHACLYNDRQGLFELREQIANYVSREYGLACTASQILVMPTTRDLISSIMTLFDSSVAMFAMENPGYDEVRKRLVEQGFEVKTIPVFPFPQWEEASRAVEGVHVVFTTPACQFPTNSAMPISLRRELVKWAEENDAYLIDDEYGWEFQSGVARTPSFAALDNAGHVITIGTFSNSFTPAVCLSYAVFPPQLMLQWRKMHRDAHPQVPWQTQAAMAMFIRDEHWRVHVRKLRTAMSRKRETLIKALATHMGEHTEVLEGPSSLFVLVKTFDGRGEGELIEAARKAGVIIYPTSRYWQDEPPEEWRYVLIGYSGIPNKEIEPGIKALAKAWGLDK